MRNGESIDSKMMCIRLRKYGEYHFEPRYIPLGLKPLLLISKSIKYVYSANPVTQSYLEHCCTSLGLKSSLSTHFRNIKKLTFHLYLSRPLTFYPQLSHFGLIYSYSFHLILNCLNLFNYGVMLV